MQAPQRQDESWVWGLSCREATDLTTDLTYLHPVRLPEAGADAGSKGTSRHTADHYRHALLTGAVALQLNLSAKLTIGQVGLVACAVDRETPVVLLTTLGQQSEKQQHNKKYIYIYTFCMLFLLMSTCFQHFRHPWVSVHVKTCKLETCFRNPIHHSNM